MQSAETQRDCIALCGERGTNNFFIIACHTISIPLKYNAFKAKVTSCNITQYHKTRIKSCTKPCTENGEICQLVVHFIDIEAEYASDDDCESNSNSNQ